MTDHPQAIRFLRWLDSDGRHTLTAIDPETRKTDSRTFGPRQWEAIERWVKARNGKHNLYFSINEGALHAPVDSKLDRSEIGALRAFAVDLDSPPSGYAWGDPCDDLVPSAIVNSGNGLWGFWRLAEKIAIDDVGAIEGQNRALAKRFGGDPVSTNIDRIARLPGTLNIPNSAKLKKGKKGGPTTIVALGAATYSPAEIAAWTPPIAPPEGVGHAKQSQTALIEWDLPESIAAATKWLESDAPEAVMGDGSNGTTYKIAAHIKDFAISREATLDLLLGHWNEAKSNPPWPADKLKTLVDHVFTYGTAAPGKASPALADVEFTAVEISDKPAPAKPVGMTYALARDINPDLKAEATYLIEDTFDRGAMVVIYGESNAGKTHVMLDQAFAIASGRLWGGRRTKKGLVIYVAAEGGRGLERRVLAHKLKYGHEAATAPLAVIRHPIDLLRAGNDAKTLIRLAKEAQVETGHECVLVVVDTLSRALAGGDENSSVDMGALVKRCDEIRHALGCTLALVHHSGKDKAKGARGHSLLRAATDTEIEIGGNAIKTTKQRDMDFGPELRFNYEPVDLGSDREGKPVSSVVLRVVAVSEFDVELTENARLLVDCVAEVAKGKLDAMLTDPTLSQQQRARLKISGMAVRVSDVLPLLVGKTKTTINAIRDSIRDGDSARKFWEYHVSESLEAGALTNPRKGLYFLA